MKIDFYIALFIFAIIIIPIMFYILFLLFKRCLLCFPKDNINNDVYNERTKHIWKNNDKIVNYNALM